MKSKTGWKNKNKTGNSEKVESWRHGQASKGIKTGRNLKKYPIYFSRFNPVGMKKGEVVRISDEENKEFLDEEAYDDIIEQVKLTKVNKEMLTIEQIKRLDSEYFVGDKEELIKKYSGEDDEE